jgi:hypothetical protein
MTTASVGLCHFVGTLRHRNYVGTAILVLRISDSNVVTDGMGDMQVLAQMMVDRHSIDRYEMLLGFQTGLGSVARGRVILCLPLYHHLSELKTFHMSSLISHTINGSVLRQVLSIRMYEGSRDYWPIDKSGDLPLTIG